MLWSGHCPVLATWHQCPVLPQPQLPMTEWQEVLRCLSLRSHSPATAQKALWKMTNVGNYLMWPCVNGATCLDVINCFPCLCPEGLSGHFCLLNREEPAWGSSIWLSLPLPQCLWGQDFWDCLTCPKPLTTVDTPLGTTLAPVTGLAPHSPTLWGLLFHGSQWRSWCLGKGLG